LIDTIDTIWCDWLREHVRPLFEYNSVICQYR